jgi:phage terminase small subunit
MAKPSKTTLDIPPAPKGLSREAKRWWGTILEAHDLQDGALLILESALECWDRMRQAQAVIEAKGMSYDDRFGQSKVRPEVLIERDMKAAMVRHLAALKLDLEPIQDGPGRPAGR